MRVGVSSRPRSDSSVPEPLKSALRQRSVTTSALQSADRQSTYLDQQRAALQGKETDRSSLEAEHESAILASSSGISYPEGMIATVTPLFHVPSKILGVECIALLDSGTSENFIADRLVTRLRLRRQNLLQFFMGHNSR